MKYRVVTTSAFWEALDWSLPGAAGPSWHQFASLDLGDIFRAVSERWDDMPTVPGGDYRIHVGSGRLGAWSVKAAWSTERREIQLVDISVHIWPPEAFDEPSVDS